VGTPDWQEKVAQRAQEGVIGIPKFYLLYGVVSKIKLNVNDSVPITLIAAVGSDSPFRVVVLKP